MNSSGVYITVEHEDGSTSQRDLIYEVTNFQFIDWVGHKIADSGGIFAVDNSIEFDPNFRYEILHMLRDNDIGFFFLKGGEYARQVAGSERLN